MSSITEIILNGTRYPLGGVTTEQKAALIGAINAIGAFDVSNGQAVIDAFNNAWGVESVYTITNQLQHVTNSNAQSTAVSGSSYTASLTAESGYAIASVSITMSGVDVTSSVYSDGTITIDEVSGNIKIIAEAVVDIGWISGVPYDITWMTGTINGTTGEYDPSGSSTVSDYLPCTGASAFVFGSGIYHPNSYVFFYDSNKNYIGQKGRNNPCPSAQNAAFIRVYSSSSSDTSQSTVTPYKYDELGESTAWTSGEYYEMPWTDGYGLNGATGEAYASGNYNLFGYSFCYGASSISVSDATRRDYAFYDSAKTRISGGTSSSDTLTVPSGAYYFRICTNNGYNMLNRVWIKLT